jgi:hypothetical protein
MICCNNCGVELDADMAHCPLCDNPENVGVRNKIVDPSSEEKRQLLYPQNEMTVPQKKIIWEIVSISILSIVVVNLAIDLILNSRIQWSEYPVAMSLILFSYISSFAFLRGSTIVKIIISFIAASSFILMIDFLTAGLQWSFSLGVPLLFTGNVIASLLILIIRMVKNKGINLIAYTLVALAFYCLCIDAVLSVFKTEFLTLSWSVIVVACVLPVAAVLMFLHFRLTRNHILERVFHI